MILSKMLRKEYTINKVRETEMKQHPLRFLREEFDFKNFDNIIEEGKDGKEKTYWVVGPTIVSETENKNGRKYQKSVCEREVERFQKNIDENRSAGELGHPSCFSETAKIMTAGGWLHIASIRDDVEVLTLNPESNTIEIHNITKKIVQDYKGTMYKFKGRNIDTLVTPNHRFLLVDRYGKSSFVMAEEIFNSRTKYNKSYIPKMGIFQGDARDFYTLKGCSEEEVNGRKYKKDYTPDLQIDMKTFVGFLGIYLAEGFLKKGRNEQNTICITQKKPHTIEKIRELLEGFPEELKWEYKEHSNCFQLTDKRLAKILWPLRDCYNKYIPYEFKNLSPSFLEELIYWFNVGDGRFDESSGYMKRNIFSTSKRLVDDLHEILLKSGGCGNMETIICESDYIFAGRVIKKENKVPLYQLSIATTKGIYLDERFLSVEKVEDYDDKVYCVTVPNETFYVMDNGKCFWSGNSPEINLERISHYIKELKQDGNIWIGKHQVASTPMGNIAKALINDGYKMGISTRGLGTVKDGVVGDDFRLITADLVSEPSGPGCFVESMCEGKQWIINECGNIEEVAVVTSAYDILETTLSTLPNHEREDYLFKAIDEFIKNIKK